MVWSFSRFKRWDGTYEGTVWTDGDSKDEKNQYFSSGMTLIKAYADGFQDQNFTTTDTNENNEPIINGLSFDSRYTDSGCLSSEEFFYTTQNRNCGMNIIPIDNCEVQTFMFLGQRIPCFMLQPWYRYRYVTCEGCVYDTDYLHTDAPFSVSGV